MSDLVAFVHDLQAVMRSEGTPAEISRKLCDLLLPFLATIRDAIPESFIVRRALVIREMMELSHQEHRKVSELLGLPKSRISDLHSVAMGIPQSGLDIKEADSDIDFTVGATYEERKRIEETLSGAGFKFDRCYHEQLYPTEHCHVYQKFVPHVKFGNVEVEVKLRYKPAVDAILIAHQGIADLSEDQKITISFIKSVLKNDHPDLYKPFKYAVYIAMFHGHEKSFILG